MRRHLTATLMAALCALLPIASGCSPLRMIERKLTPDAPFDPAKSPPAFDYSSPTAWAALPDRADRADLVPEGVEGGDRQATAAVDVFFIHPTTYYNAAHWNQPPGDARADELTDNSVMAGQASAFNGCCRVYAPHYRQATLASYFRSSDSSRQAFELAYKDVSTAFAWYLEHYNAGRPFIVASHSQGTMHAMRLLEEIDQSPIRERMVAAYLVGFQMPLDKFERSYKNIRPCKEATDTGCVVAWDTLADGTKAEESDTIGAWYGSKLEPRKGKQILCTNPLTWTAEATPGDAEKHLGALSPSRSGSLRQVFFSKEPMGLNVTKLEKPLPRFTRARCQDGFLYVPAISDESYGNLRMFKGNYHIYDYAIFYMNVRENARQRAERFLQGRAVAGDAPPAQ